MQLNEHRVLRTLPGTMESAQFRVCYLLVLIITHDGFSEVLEIVLVTS